MTKLTGIDGKPMVNVDESKVAPSKLKCMRSESLQGLLEAWAVGDIGDADAQTWLLFQTVVNLMQLNLATAGTRIVRPS